MTAAFLVGAEPGVDLGYRYVAEPPFDAVVIGSLTLSQQLHFAEESVLEALAQGKPVLLYTPGLAAVPANRALAATLAAKRRELKSWGVVFTEGTQRKLITAQQAAQMLERGEIPAPGAVLTPLAKEILQ